jgi:anthranilate synthase
MFQYLQRPMATQKAPYRYALEFVETKICGASPEILVDMQKNIVTSRPISGSIRRNGESETLTEHELHELQKLHQSEKEKCELDMLIDLARNDLNRVCTNVSVSNYRQELILEHIIHTQATVTGKLKPGFTQIQSLLSCLNAGTLVGAPKIKAMEIIAELENHPRGYYGGNLVHMKPDGNLTAIILIRTAFLSNDILKIQAGSSVVLEANEQYEFWECGSKLKNILKMINQEKLCFTDCKPPQIVSNNLEENSDKLSNQLNYNKFYAKQEFDENSIQNNSSKYKLLMIDNFDSFTYNLISLFEKCGCNVDVIKNNVKEFDFSAYDGVLLSPGPSHPKQAGYLIKHVKNLIDNKPLFGVCLGFQAIIESLGGSISRMQNPLHGKSRRCYVNKSNVLFHNLPHQFNVARYHSLFADKIPNEVNIVAYDENKIPLALECFSNGRNLCAVQFHPESFLTGEVGIQIINNWLRNIKHESK